MAQVHLLSGILAPAKKGAGHEFLAGLSIMFISLAVDSALRHVPGLVY
jgi:hypothetical protein